MSPDISTLVEKFPHCTAAERDQLLNFARTTPLIYGAWKPFKQLFKKAEAKLGNNADIELMGVLLDRIDSVNFTRSSTRWKAVEETRVQGKEHKITAGGVTYIVGGRSMPDYQGWRLVISRQAAQGPSVLNVLRRAIDKVTDTPQASVKAFDLDARTYIYRVKDVSLDNGKLSIACGSPHQWRGSQERDQTFVVDVSDPNFIHLRDDGPETPTLQYMKRRARRILRHLSKKNPEVYLQLASQLLREHGDKPLDPALNWAAMDVLFAGSPRWQQPQAGRGPYQKTTGRFVRRRREERAPEIWDTHLEQAFSLLARSDVPIEANEMAFKVLHAQGEDFTNRVLERAQLLRFLTSSAPLLQYFATRQLSQIGEQFDGAMWAHLNILADARTRRALNALPLSDDVAWNEQAERVLSETLEKRTATKKRRAAHLLVEHFADRIGDYVLWHNLATFADVSEQTRAWMLGRVRQSAHNGEFARLRVIARLRPDLRETLLRAFSEEAANASPGIEQVTPLVLSSDQDVNETGWQFLATTALSRDVARELWWRVWSSRAPLPPSPHEMAAQITAAQSHGAFQLFERADFSGAQVETALLMAPTFFSNLEPAFFAAVFRRVSPAIQVERALTANDNQWQAAREVLLQTLENSELLGIFWNQVLDRVAAGEDEALNRRILDDAPIAATFEQMPKEAVTDLFAHTPMEHEPYLVRWLDANGSQLERSDAALLAAATHPFGGIRERGLALVREVGLDLPLALRLMESGLPQPFDLARSWFETNDVLDVADRALVLCDSPDARVRSFGREFLEAQGERVLDAGVLRKLSENFDPVMQAWLAEHVLQNAKDVELTTFDQTILRTRGRARRAKEAVKKRRDVARATAPRQYSNDDIAALLDVARGRTTRDREWALQQLAQAALSGHAIEGVQVQRADNAPSGAGGE